MPNSEDPLIDRVLSERYRILKKLGEGGMGVVYLAEHVVIEKKIALKVLFPDLTRRSDLVQRFMQEAKSASRIGHENVIDITDFGQSPEGYVFIAMEYLVGQDLGQLLKTTGPLPWERAQPIVLQIVKALRAAHERGIVHRDMKPENVFVSPRDDGREFVKVLDFGIAKVLGLDDDAPRLTRTGMIFGTPEYMSPEQAQGQQVDHRVDIYAVGCILYHMLTGEVPFKAESFMGILSKHMLEAPVPAAVRNPAIAPEVEAVISRAMEKNPARRYQTMGELVQALVPLGHIPDKSGAVAMGAGSSLHRTGMPAAALAVPSPSADPTGKVSLPPSQATREVPGRVSAPLAQSNPEATRSQTEIVPRDTGDRAAEGGRGQRRGRIDGNTSRGRLVVAAAAAALAVLAILFFVLRGGGTGGAVTAGAGRAAVAPPAAAAAVLLPPPLAVPATATANERSAPTAGSGHSEVRTTPPARASTAVKANGHSRRSSREAIDSLFPADSGDTVPPTGTKGSRTPSELKNPFAAP